jgi:hypothetical protein
MRLLHRKTEGVADHCEYGTCGKPAVGELRGHNLRDRGDIPWAMCAEHVQPKHHPADLHKKLIRW